MRGEEKGGRFVIVKFITVVYVLITIMSMIEGL